MHNGRCRWEGRRSSVASALCGSCNLLFFLLLSNALTKHFSLEYKRVKYKRNEVQAMNVVKCRNWTQIRPCYARGHYHLALPPGLIGGGDNRYVSTIRHLVQQKTSTALLPAIFGNTLYTLRLCNLRQSQSSPHREALRKTTSGLLPPRWKTVEID